jgi:hypothetical protein
MNDPVPSNVKGATTNTTQDPTVAVEKQFEKTANDYSPSKNTNMESYLAVLMGETSKLSNSLTPFLKDPVPSNHHGAMLHSPPHHTVAVEQAFGTMANFDGPSKNTIMEPLLAVVMGENSKLSNSLTPSLKDPIPSNRQGAMLHSPPHPSVAVEQAFGTTANFDGPSKNTIMEPSLAVVMGMGENSKLSNSLTPSLKDPVPSNHQGAMFQFLALSPGAYFLLTCLFV